MSTALLVHGAWCTAWAWDDLIPEVDHLGISSKAIDMPCHGENTRSMWCVSLADYAMCSVPDLLADTLIEFANSKA